MDFWLHLLILIVQCVVLALATTTAFAYLTLFERRLLARLQNRVGPNRAGPNGFLQPLADAIKLFFKEDLTPAMVDRWVYILAPALAIVPAIIIWAVLPLGCWNILGSFAPCFNPVTPAPTSEPFWNILLVADGVNVGVLYLLAVTSIGVYGITLAGWASNNKYSMLGGIRSAAQLVSYELALGMAVLSAVMTAGSLDVTKVVQSQYGFWAIIPQFLGFVLFMVSSTAEVVRAPFDLVEAEQELVGGYNTEYGSMKFALFFMAEYLKLIAVSAIAVTLFLGGWHFPGLETLGQGLVPIIGITGATIVVGLASLGAFLLKVVALLFVSVWIRASWPRMRYDQLMNLGWKWLLPLALVNIIATAVVTVLVTPEFAAGIGLSERVLEGIILFVVGVAAIGIAAAIGRPKRPEIAPIQLVQVRQDA
jgi:NADH-quinone oxidoreductase subunit H